MRDHYWCVRPITVGHVIDWLFLRNRWTAFIMTHYKCGPRCTCIYCIYGTRCMNVPIELIIIGWARCTLECMSSDRILPSMPILSRASGDVRRFEHYFLLSSNTFCSRNVSTDFLAARVCHFKTLGPPLIFENGMPLQTKKQCIMTRHQPNVLRRVDL